MRDHIFAVAEYLSDTLRRSSAATPTRSYAFDVVNEVVSRQRRVRRRPAPQRVVPDPRRGASSTSRSSTRTRRSTTTYAAAGADRPVTLFINDYNTEQGGKQARYHALVERLLARGVPVDGVGSPVPRQPGDAGRSALDGALDRVRGPAGARRPSPSSTSPTGTPVTQANLIEQGYYYRDAFRIFRAHADDLFSVTVWGLTDGRSWRAGTGAPLVFDDGLQAKPAYYGIVDGDLPARLRTANVFAGDVPLDAGATTALEWQQLPLHAIDDARRVPAALGAGPPDGVRHGVPTPPSTRPTGSSSCSAARRRRSARDGTGDVPAWSTERAGGYDVVAHLPLDHAGRAGRHAAPSTCGSRDGADHGRAGTRPGALGHAHAASSRCPTLEVAAGRHGARRSTATIDAAWADAGTPSRPSKQVQGTGGATARRSARSGRTRRCTCSPRSPTRSSTSRAPTRGSRTRSRSTSTPATPRTAPTGYDDTQIRISADNVVSFGTGDEAFQRGPRASARRARSATGYVVEAAISLLEYGGLGTLPRPGLPGQRRARTAPAPSIRNWADPTGAGYQTTARWGVAAAGRGRRPVVDHDADGSAVEPGVRLVVAGHAHGDGHGRRGGVGSGGVRGR